MIENILAQLKQNLESIKPVDPKYTVSKGQNNGFELMVNDTLHSMKSDVSNSCYINFDFKLHYGSHFPDLDIYIDNKIYGIEIKSRQKLNWTTNGNSVMESISSSDYDDIFLFFGAYGEKEDQYFIRYSPYWAAVEGIKVTHSPRFYINMESTGQVFSNKDEYNELRNSDEVGKVKFLQNYLKEKSKGTKWYIPLEENEVLPINFSKVDSKIKSRIIAEIFILFPNDLIKFKSDGSSASSYYNNAMEYLISSYFYYSSSLRDQFSAGGKFFYEGVEYARVIETFMNHKQEINNILETANDEFVDLAMKTWSKNHLVINEHFNSSFKENYYHLLNKISLPSNHDLSNFLK